MHKDPRFLSLAVLAATMLTVPFAMQNTKALLTPEDRTEAEQQLQSGIGKAVSRYRQGNGLQSERDNAQQRVDELRPKAKELGKKKFEMRKRIIQTQKDIKKVANKYNISFNTKEDVIRMSDLAKSRFTKFVQIDYRRRLLSMEHISSALRVVSTVMQRIPYTPTPRAERVQKQYEVLLSDMHTAENAFDEQAELLREREIVLEEYWKNEHELWEAESDLNNAKAQLYQVKKVMEEVQADVLRLQGELARIDAKIRSKAERELIEKGLLDPKEAGAKTAAAKPQFSWPVYGRISAGFADKNYLARFGFPHRAIDIPVLQGTAVRSAADGVVFLVRDGGEKGYTYILMGHSNNFATLYGHLIDTTVTSGQDVRAGEVIGLSGGEPGTHGAGPTTTGPHLHFEVIQGGTNINPLNVLP